LQSHNATVPVEIQIDSDDDDDDDDGGGGGDIAEPLVVLSPSVDLADEDVSGDGLCDLSSTPKSHGTDFLLLNVDSSLTFLCHSL
jgi:hypothetical protein